MFGIPSGQNHACLRGLPFDLTLPWRWSGGFQVRARVRVDASAIEQRVWGFSLADLAGAYAVRYA